MIERLKKYLKEDRRTVKWFFDTQIKGVVDIGYSGLCAQLNGYANLSDDVKKAIEGYLNVETPNS